MLEWYIQNATQVTNYDSFKSKETSSRKRTITDKEFRREDRRSQNIAKSNKEREREKQVFQEI